MEKLYFKINFDYVKDGAILSSYCFVRAHSAETAKQILVSELSQTHGNVKPTACVQITKAEYEKAMFS